MQQFHIFPGSWPSFSGAGAAGWLLFSGVAGWSRILDLSADLDLANLWPKDFEQLLLQLRAAALLVRSAQR